MNKCGHGYGYGCLFELVNGHWRIQFGGGDWDFWIAIFWNHSMDWLVSWLLVAWSVGYKEIGYSALLFHFQSYFVFTDTNVVPWRS
jgi:hypothetical protein